MAKLYFTPNLTRHTACPESDLAAATVAELFRSYFEAWPGVQSYVLDDQGAVRKHIKIIVDGRNLRDREALSDRLEPDSKVYVFQALSGG